MNDDDPTMLVLRRRVRRWAHRPIVLFAVGFIAAAVLATLMAWIGSAIRVYGARP